jgi:hypothetical protein
MPKNSQIPYRSLKDVSDDELQKAVEKMVLDLGISGSGHEYSLYNAVLKEKEKAALANSTMNSEE